jgi:hypothetical protein
MISVAGQPKMLSTVDDITDQRRLRLQHRGALAAYQAIAAFTERALAGGGLRESLAPLPAQMRSTAAFSSALLWDRASASTISGDGEDPWPALVDDLARGRPLSGSEVTLVIRSDATAPQDGYAVRLPEAGCDFMLLARDTASDSSRALIARILGDLARAVRAVAPHVGE